MLEHFKSAVLFVTLVFCASLGAIVLLRLLRGDIRTQGLLSAKTGAPLQASRLQAFVGSLGGLFLYLIEVAKVGAVGDLPSLPAPSDLVLAALGGGNFFYLFAKYLQTPGGKKRWNT